MSFADVKYEDFVPLVGSDFVLPGDDTAPPIHFKLTEVISKGKAPRPEFRDPFTLIFRVDTQDVYAQSTYRLVHADMGECDVFLVPTGKDADGVEYCSTFN